MNYSSPYKWLDISPDLIPDRELILNAKKTALARLELSGKSTIKLHRKDYTKDGLVKLFDELLETTGWNEHQLIAEDEGLLRFLETGNGRYAWYYSEAYQNPAFVEFIAPWFVPAYVAHVLMLIKEGKPHELQEFFGRFSLLNDQGVKEVKFRLQQSLDEESVKLEQLSEDLIALKATRKSVLRAYYSSEKIECLNMLSDDLTECRSRYALALLSLYIEMYNKLRYGRECGKLISNLATIKCDTPTQRKVQHYLAFDLENNESIGTSGFNVFWVVIRIVAIGALVARCAMQM